jgi:hypothetical protein
MDKEVIERAEQILATNLGMAEIITRKAFESGIEFIYEQYKMAMDKPPAHVDVISSHMLDLYVEQFIKSLQGR